MKKIITPVPVSDGVNLLVFVCDILTRTKSSCHRGQNVWENLHLARHEGKQEVTPILGEHIYSTTEVKTPKPHLVFSEQLDHAGVARSDVHKSAPGPIDKLIHLIKVRKNTTGVEVHAEVTVKFFNEMACDGGPAVTMVIPVGQTQYPELFAADSHIHS